MIYFDNAATTKYKPELVYEAVNYYLRNIGVSPGRGSYSLGIEASRMLYKARCIVGKFFGMSRPESVVFTKNSTEAINLFFNGFLKHGDHVIISCYEHNAVLRPLHHLQESGIIDYSVIKREDLDLSPDEIYSKYAKKNTRLLAMTLASNLTGRIVYREDLFHLLKKKGIATFVDASQGAGKIPLNMKDESIDFLAFTGHKDLLAIPGVGGLCCESDIHFEPMIQGGTGVHGEQYTNPDIFPDGYEAGTLNMPAIWSLYAGIGYVSSHRESIQKKECDLLKYLMERLSSIDDVMIYDEDVHRVSTCCINLNSISSDRLVALLDSNGICVRGGIHCAILAHEAIGTVSTGAVRISLGFMNTMKEIDELVEVLRKVGG